MLPFSIDTDQDTICSVIRRWAEIQPDAPALITADKSVLTYRALADVIDRVRADLKTRGLGRGDRVGIVHSGSIETGILTLGVFSCATAIPLDPRQTAAEFTEKLSELGAHALIVGPDVPDAIIESGRELGLTVIKTRPCRIGGEGGFEAWIGLAAEPVAEADRSIPVGGDDIAYVLATSGTTQRSKIVPSKHKRVLAFSEQRHVVFELSPGDICALARPVYYSAGLNCILISLYSGGAVLVLPEFESGQFLQCLGDHGATWFAAGPAMLKAIHGHLMEFPEAAGGLSLHHITQSTGYLEPEIIGDLERMLETSVRTSYASSETGLIAVSRPGPGPGPRGLAAVTGLSENIDMGDSGVRIRSSHGRFLPTGESGEIVVRGLQVFDGYENSPEANAEAFVDGWLRTGDQGFFDEDGTLTLTGRIGEIINRGGEKVSPSEVDAAILSHPDVQDAAAFPLRHPTLGQEVAAAVVQAPGAALTDQILTGYLLARLSGFKVPRRFYFVPAIPKTPAGKLQRYQLAEALGVSEDVGTHVAGASDREATALEAQLQAIWAKALRIPHIGLDENFFMLGGDSLQAVELFLRVQQDLGLHLPRSVLFEAGTVAEMAQRIEDLTPSPCLVPIQLKGDGSPFFCVHDGNGEVLNYRDLARLVGEAQPFYGIQCRGLDREGVPFTRIEDMAAHYVQEVKRVQPAGPYYVGGYSFGGRVAYVMAQQLRAAGEEVALLALLDTASGYGQRRVGPGDWLAHHRQRLKALPASKMPAYLWLRVANLVGMVYMGSRIKCFAVAWRFFQSHNRPVPRFMRRPVPANDMIRRSYEARPYDGDATLFKAELYAWNHTDTHEGWRELIKGNLEIRPIPGRHYEIVDQPHVQALAADLADALNKAQAASAGPAKVLGRAT